MHTALPLLTLLALLLLRISLLLKSYSREDRAKHLLSRSDHTCCAGSSAQRTRSAVPESSPERPRSILLVHLEAPVHLPDCPLVLELLELEGPLALLQLRHATQGGMPGLAVLQRGLPRPKRGEKKVNKKEGRITKSAFGL